MGMMAAMNRWLLIIAVLLLVVLVTAWSFPESYAGAVAVYTFVFVGLFSGTFGLLWGGSAFDASVNDWVADVRRMEVSGRHHWTWLYENRRRQWAAEVTLFAVGFAVFIGAFLCSGTFAYENSVVGFVTSLSFLMTIALCWYKGYWKPRTKAPAPQVPQSIEAEWRDKRL